MATLRTPAARKPKAGEKVPTLADKPRVGQTAARPCYRYVLSSGLFGLPANAQSVDWMVLNNSAKAQAIRVTVYRAGVGPKTPVAPGALVLTLAPYAVTHNANSVGAAKPFVPGFYYEVVVETNDSAVLPSVHVWQDHANTVIAGTLISPGTFARI